MTVIYIIPLYVLAFFCARLFLKDPTLLEKTATPGMYWQLNGLRFFLAFSVFLHHLFMMRYYFETGKAGLTPDNFITFLGQGGVSFFFIITSFLFWDRAINFPHQFNSVEFFIGRLRRLTPAYISVVIPFLMPIFLRPFMIDWIILRQVLEILSLGFFGVVDVGGLGLKPNIGVFWTLFYEWRFYLILPLLYTFLRIKNHIFVTTICCIIILFISSFSPFPFSKDWPYISLFAVGILSANIHNSHYFSRINVSQVFLQIVLGLSILLNLALGVPYYGYTKPIFFLFSFLILLKLDRDSAVGRLINNKPILLLGLASYSTYISHNIIIAMMRNILPVIKPRGDLQFFIIFAVSSLLVSLLSIIIFKYIELPYAFRRTIPQGANLK